LNVLRILAPQPLLWQTPVLAIVVNLWVVFAVIAGVPYGGASWLNPREE
jgi:hypothetical protein